jgi:antitoxin (DNA-binding transcriptional repressor) of toxin-antitoxin stability system
MMTVSINDFSLNLMKYIDIIKQGQSITVSDTFHPIFYIQPVLKQEKMRPYGLCKNEFTIPNDFNEPLPDEIIANFEAL